MLGPTRERRGADRSDRWVERRALAAAIRLGALFVPVVSGFAAGLLAAQWLPRPAGAARLLWALAVLAVSSGCVTGVDRLARRALPLATLLRLSLVFPDRVPSRFRLARQAGNVRVLERRMAEAREHGLDDDPARAAEQILTLVAALSAHDRKTRGHSERVRAFTDMLADEFGLTDDDRDRLRWAALLHDLGKLDVPSKILNKPGKPNEAEWERLRLHPLEGERIAAPLLPWLGPWGAVIAQHHERWDGGGYPGGLAGDDIALGARIVSVADSFEVMTAARSYKRPMTARAARQELERCAGEQFDPEVVRAFLNISLGRLWWAVGPVSWIAQIPFLLRIGEAGGQAVGVARAATAVAVNGLAGVLALGVGTTALPPSTQAVRAAAVTSPATSRMPTLELPTVAAWPGVAPSPQGGRTDPESDSRQGPTHHDDDVGADPAPDADPPAGPPQTNELDDGRTDDPPAEPDSAPSDRNDRVDPVVDPVRDVVDGVTDAVDEVAETVDDVVGRVDEVIEDVTDPVGEVVGGVTGAVGQVVNGAVGGLLR